jgi:hypothetical protein
MAWERKHALELQATASGQPQIAEGAVSTRGYFLSIVLASFALLLAPAQSTANDLKEQTLAAWDGYVNSACSRAEARAKEPPFLRIDEVPERRLQVRAGETTVWRESEGHPAKVPHGLIHDWMGATFIPKVTIGDVLAVVRDYDRYAQVYTPAVIEANRLGSEENADRFSMLLMQKVLFVTAATKGEYETRYIQVDAKRWYSISKSTRLQSIENFGQPGMRELPPDQGPGYVWRLFSFTKFEESDGGVFIEVEAIGLSRDVPMLVRWLVDPIVEQLPKNSLQATLDETRNAVVIRNKREDSSFVLAASNVGTDHPSTRTAVGAASGISRLALVSRRERK